MIVYVALILGFLLSVYLDVLLNAKYVGWRNNLLSKFGANMRDVIDNTAPEHTLQAWHRTSYILLIAFALYFFSWSTLTFAAVLAVIYWIAFSIGMGLKIASNWKHVGTTGDFEKFFRKHTHKNVEGKYMFLKAVILLIVVSLHFIILS